MTRRRLVVRGGEVRCALSGTRGPLDVLVEDGLIVALLPRDTAVDADVDVLDARGALVAPMAFDVAMSARVGAPPDVEQPAALATRLLSAGVCAVIGARVDDDAGRGAIDDERAAAAATALFSLPGQQNIARPVAVAPTLTKGGAGKELSDLATAAAAAAAPGLRPVFRALDPVDDGDVLRRALDVVAALDGVCVLPSVDGTLGRRGIVVESAIATRLGLPGVPEAAELIGVQRAVEMSRLTGARVHVAGVFSAAGAAAVAAAAAAGARVSGSTTTLQLCLDERALLQRRYDTALRVWPPLPTAASRDALLAAVNDGTLAVGTGHDDAAPREKALEFAAARPGADILDDAWPLLSHLLGPDVALGAMARPALEVCLRAGVHTGAEARLAVVDPGASGVVAMRTRGGRDNPCADMPTRGAVRAAVLGEVVWRPPPEGGDR